MAHVEHVKLTRWEAYDFHAFDPYYILVTRKADEGHFIDQSDYHTIVGVGKSTVRIL